MSKKAEGFSLRFVLINTGNISRKVLSKVLRSFDKNFERLQAERLEKMGIEKGLKQGIGEGIKQGIKQGIELGKTAGIHAEKVRVYKHLIEKGFSEKEAREIAELPETLNV